MPVAFANNAAPTGNLILSAVPVKERASALGELRCVHLRGAATLSHAGERVADLFFPLDSVIAAVGVDRRGGTAENALIGAEGFLGLNALLGDSRSRGHAIVALPGRCYRLSTTAFTRAFEAIPTLRRAILRYASSRAFQASQTILCAAHHSVRQRLCRWLLQASDRAGTTQLLATRELIATALGVRREAVSIAAVRLQQERAIRCGRGHISLVDRDALLAASCECYGEMKADLDLTARDIAGM